MTAPLNYPETSPCGHCETSTPVNWEPVGYGGWVGEGRCPACGSFVITVGGNPLLFDYLMEIAADKPDAVIRGSFEVATR
jgi:hypothetical protein